MFTVAFLFVAGFVPYVSCTVVACHLFLKHFKEQGIRRREMFVWSDVACLHSHGVLRDYGANFNSWHSLFCREVEK